MRLADYLAEDTRSPREAERSTESPGSRRHLALLEVHRLLETADPGTATSSASSGRPAVAGRVSRPGLVDSRSSRHEPWWSGSLPRAARAAAILLAGVVAGCAGPASTLAPRGLGAERNATLTWVLFAVGAAVYLLVLGVLLFAVMRRRPASDPDLASEHADRRGRVAVVAGGVVLPLLVVPVLFALSVRTLGQLVREERSSLVVDVTAQQYWWELRYRDAGRDETVTTANELHVPVGQTVEIRLFSIDVIHSFWVPALQGKLDAIPGNTNVTWIRAERAGTFPGQCAEYCGMQHALMRLFVVAQPHEEFGRWLAAQARPAAPPAGERAQRGAELFLLHCARCHAVRGTPAFFGQGGPDLTHVASRRTLAAGTLTNVTGNLAGWIADPQTLKPGNGMPRIPLPAADFHAVLEYVGALR